LIRKYSEFESATMRLCGALSGFEHVRRATAIMFAAAAENG
jgi:hypothetical protein